MSVALITGSLGLLGQSCVKRFKAAGLRVIGIDNNARTSYFGVEPLSNGEEHELYKADITQKGLMGEVFQRHGKEISIIIHTAAQPSHDWSGIHPFKDFEINAEATAFLLWLTKQYCPEAVFIYVSTSKVYGDFMNKKGYDETDTRYSLRGYSDGFEEMDISNNVLRSPFGADKLAADIVAQEHGRYYGMKVGIFRPGCITGPAHKGAELHGFLAYLVKCAKEGKQYEIYGYKGKQVRDNIHADDLAEAFFEFYKNPMMGEVFNIGGGKYATVSILEAISYVEKKLGKEMVKTYIDTPRVGDHKWWVSCNDKFRSYYRWNVTKTTEEILDELIEHGK